MINFAEKNNSCILIDTSAWIHALRPAGIKEIREYVSHLLAEDRGAICEMVILEVLKGVRDRNEYLKLYKELLALRQLTITKQVWEQAYQLGHQLHIKGITVPSADQVIAAVALTYSIPLLQCDKHFNLIANHSNLLLAQEKR